VGKKTDKIHGKILLFVIVSLIPRLVYAEKNQAELLFFYEAGCPHCARVEQFLDQRVKFTYPVEIKKYEIHQPEHARMLGRFAGLYNTEVSTPSVVVGDTIILGDERRSLRLIEESLRDALRKNNPSPLTLLEDQKNIRQKVSISAVLGAAAVDAINPCACAVLTLLLGTILVGKKKRSHVIRAGLAFTASTLISYLLMGLGLFYAISLAGIQQYIYIGVSILAILIGLGNMKDYIWPEKWFNMEVPRSWRPRLQEITSRVTSVPAAFGIGFLVSVFLLPCTSGPYVVVIGMLSESSSKLTALWLLIIYNLIFILPFIAITLGVGYGLTTTARVEKLRQEKLKKIHLITGSVMLAIGIGLMVLVFTGYI
jgi:cytochrome c biogenesis protein CcdA/glutaredoxin